MIHVEVPEGHQIIDNLHGVSKEEEDRARWNFTFSYNVALDPDNGDLEDYTGWLLIDVDPSAKTRYLPLKLTRLTDTPSGQGSGYGWSLKNSTPIPDDEGTSQVTQNSRNLAFYEDFIDADPETPGQQSYADTDYGQGRFDVIMMLEPKRRHGKAKAALHVAFDVVEGEDL